MRIKQKYETSKKVHRKARWLLCNNRISIVFVSKTDLAASGIANGNGGDYFVRFLSNGDVECSCAHGKSDNPDIPCSHIVAFERYLGIHFDRTARW